MYRRANYDLPPINSKPVGWGTKKEKNIIGFWIFILKNTFFIVFWFFSRFWGNCFIFTRKKKVGDWIWSLRYTGIEGVGCWRVELVDISGKLFVGVPWITDRLIYQFRSLSWSQAWGKTVSLMNAGVKQTINFRPVCSVRITGTCCPLPLRSIPSLGLTSCAF